MNKRFIGYEHREILIGKKYVDIYADAYPNFGWQVDILNAGKENHEKVLLKMKRNRKLVNQSELKRLQNKFESRMAGIKKLEMAKSLLPTVMACLIGIAGTALVAGAVFANDAGHTLMMIILGAIGIIGWVLPYLIFKMQLSKSIRKYQPLIDHEYDLIYQICEKSIYFKQSKRLK